MDLGEVVVGVIWAMGGFAWGERRVVVEDEWGSSV